MWPLSCVWHTGRAGRARDFPCQVLRLFGDALRLRDRFLAGQVNAAACERGHERFVNRLLDLTERPRANAANQLFAQHLRDHAEQWLMFLLEPHNPATNHRAEQALKTPIVNRKVWGGNRTWNGSVAQKITSSVLKTCRNLAHDIIRYVSNAFRGFVGQLFPPTARSPATYTAK